MICNGPRNAKIILLGEAPGPDELRTGIPFSGSSGWELDKMLTEAGISRSTCFACNVIDERPSSGQGMDLFSQTKTEVKKLGTSELYGMYPRTPNMAKSLLALKEVIEAIEPNLVIALGNIALWAMVGEECLGGPKNKLPVPQITKWRGSILEPHSRYDQTFKIIPTFNPAFVQRNWPARAVVVQDFRRCARESLTPTISYPKRNYILRPTIDQALTAVKEAKGELTTNDLEVANNQITCVGIGFSKNDAICIPFMTNDVDRDNSYWSKAEELELTIKMKESFTDPKTKLIFQNGHFDLQIYAMQWGYLPNISDDTMIMQHVCYPQMRKSLDFQSSMYAMYYRFWKDDGKYWQPGDDPEIYWKYNMDDCCYTFENFHVLSSIIEKRNLTNAYKTQMEIFHPVLLMMLRGVRIDVEYKNKLKGILQEEIRKRSEWFEKVLGHPLNPLSNAPTGQMRKLFYDDFKLKPIISRKTRSPTLDDEALDTIMKIYPSLKLLCQTIQEFRSLNTFKSNYAEMRLSVDDRVRCGIKITGTETFRFATDKNIHGEGRNLQNIPAGHSLDDD